MAKLLVVGSQGEQRIALTGQQVIGREPSCDIVLQQDAVSARHALLTTEDDQTTIEDLDSTNGTFVNNERVRSRVLEPGDRIRLGDQVVVFAEEDLGPEETFELDSYNELDVDVATRRVWRGGRELDIRLTPQEFELLSYLSKHRGEVCSRVKIGEAIWGDGAFDDAMLYQLIRRLREKVEIDPGKPEHVKTVPRVGYRLD